jgi:hypothetical protein
MTEANLLVSSNFLDWSKNVDLKNKFDDISLLIVETKINNDKSYGNPSFYDNGINSTLENLLSGFNKCKAIYPWLSYNHYKNIMHLVNLGITANSSSNLQLFDAEFNGENNGIIHTRNSNNKHVNSGNSLRKLHADFIDLNHMFFRNNHYDYFIEYYIPSLKLTPAAISSIINANRNLFDRLDVPQNYVNGPIHNQSVHVHLANGNALNLNGTYHHKNNNNRIPTGANNMMISWGFLLPDDI